MESHFMTLGNVPSDIDEMDLVEQIFSSSKKLKTFMPHLISVEILFRKNQALLELDVAPSLTFIKYLDGVKICDRKLQVSTLNGNKSHSLSNAVVKAALDGPCPRSPLPPSPTSESTPVEAPSSPPMPASHDTPVEATPSPPIPANQKVPVEATPSPPIPVNCNTPVEATPPLPIPVRQNVPVEVTPPPPIPVNCNTPVEATPPLPIPVSQNVPVEVTPPPPIPVNCNTPGEATPPPPIPANHNIPVEATPPPSPPTISPDRSAPSLIEVPLVQSALPTPSLEPPPLAFLPLPTLPDSTSSSSTAVVTSFLTNDDGSVSYAVLRCGSSLVLAPVTSSTGTATFSTAAGAGEQVLSVSSVVPTPIPAPLPPLCTTPSWEEDLAAVLSQQEPAAAPRQPLSERQLVTSTTTVEWKPAPAPPGPGRAGQAVKRRADVIAAPLSTADPKVRREDAAKADSAALAPVGQTPFPTPVAPAPLPHIPQLNPKPRTTRAPRGATRATRPAPRGARPSSIVFFDLETTGLDVRFCEIVQVAAKCGGRTFSVYMMPKRGIPAAASRINKLTVVRGKLLKNGAEVPVVDPLTAWKSFLSFLRGLDCSVILLGHNAANYDFPLLMRDLRVFGLVAELRALVSGGVDSLHIFRSKVPRRCSYRQVDLALAFGVPIRNAHDALGDVTMLEELCSRLAVSAADVARFKKPLPTR